MAEHREVNLRRPGDADGGGSATAHQRHPSFVQLQWIAGVAVVVPGKGRVTVSGYLTPPGTVRAKPMQRTAGLWLRTAAGCRLRGLLPRHVT